MFLTHQKYVHCELKKKKIGTPPNHHVCRIIINFASYHRRRTSHNDEHIQQVPWQPVSTKSMSAIYQCMYVCTYTQLISTQYEEYRIKYYVVPVYYLLLCTF